MGIDIKELTEAEMHTVGGRSGKWDKQGMIDFAKEISTAYANKVVGMPLESLGKGKSEGFYNKFYHGTGRIKYISYYCRKHLLDAFNAIGINADVRTTKNTLLIQFKGVVAEDAAETETEVEESEEESAE